MKKLLLIAIAILGLNSASFATGSMCRTTGNVEVSLSGNGSKELDVKFTNYNSYMVTVHVTVKVVCSDGTERNDSDIVIVPANDSKSRTYQRGKTTSYVSTSDSEVEIYVEKCD